MKNTPPLLTKKFCHRCWHWKYLHSAFRLYCFQAERHPHAHCDWCKECEMIYGYYRPRTWKDKHETDLTSEKEDEHNSLYHWGFIGNKPYKEICEIFKIDFQENQQET